MGTLSWSGIWRIEIVPFESVLQRRPGGLLVHTIEDEMEGQSGLVLWKQRYGPKPRIPIVRGPGIAFFRDYGRVQVSHLPNSN